MQMTGKYKPTHKKVCSTQDQKQKCWKYGKQTTSRKLEGASVSLLPPISVIKHPVTSLGMGSSPGFANKGILSSSAKIEVGTQIVVAFTDLTNI